MSHDEARSRLLAKRAATLGHRDTLARSFTDIVDGARDANVDDEHDPEGSTVAAERSMVASLGRGAQERLAQIDRALARLDDATYGVCLRCGVPIDERRLAALPAAEHCVDCARRSRA